MKSLLEFKAIVEEEKSDYSKFDTLVRAGLANKAQMQRIHKILDKMGEEKPTFNNADRMIIQNLFNKMVDLISNNKQINMQARRAVREDVEELTDEPVMLQEDKDPPLVLVIKRKAIRLYPDGTRIALYYNEKLKKYFSVPYQYGSGMDAPIQSEETKQINEYGNPKLYQKAAEIAKGKKIKMVEEPITEMVMDTLHKIVKDKSAQSVKFASGQTRKVDHFTASALTQVHNALNDDNKKKFADMVHKSPEHFMKASDFAFKRAK
jgi:hypothetical protein